MNGHSLVCENLIFTKLKKGVMAPLCQDLEKWGPPPLLTKVLKKLTLPFSLLKSSTVHGDSKQWVQKKSRVSRNPKPITLSGILLPKPRSTCSKHGRSSGYAGPIHSMTAQELSLMNSGLQPQLIVEWMLMCAMCAWCPSIYWKGELRKTKLLLRSSLFILTIEFSK